MEMIADTTRPSESDVPHLLAVRKLMTHCREQALQLYGQPHLVFVPVLTKDFTDADLDYGKLVRREMSWGQYADATMNRTERLFAGLRDANDQVQVNLQHAREYELEQRRNARGAADCDDLLLGRTPHHLQLVLMGGLGRRASRARQGLRVNHKKGEYVRGDARTNTVEGFFSIFKRGLTGVYQHCGEQRLHRYLAEFDFRYSNQAKLGVDDSERATAMLKGIVGKRLTYRRINQEQTT
jgi:hypothetical protein